MRRRGHLALAVTGALAAVLLGAGVALVIAGRTDGGRRALEHLTRTLTRGRVEITGLGGAFPQQLTARAVTLRDRQGVWLAAEGISLRWRPLSLFARQVHIDDLHVARVALARLPAGAPGPAAPLPRIPVIDVVHAAVDRLELGPLLAGRPAALALHGSVRLRSLQDLAAQAEAARIDGGGGRYSLRLAFDSARLDARISVREPAGGPLENLLGLPQLGGLSATLDLNGPRPAERIDLRILAGGLRARAQGTANLGARTADLSYSVLATAMNPRPGLGWRRIEAEGHWRGGLDTASAGGTVEIRDLQVGGAGVGDVRAALAGSGGELALRGRMTGLRIPGPRPDLLGRDPVTFDATFSPRSPDRGIEVGLHHPLLSLRGRIRTAAPAGATFDLDVPQIAPLADGIWRGRASIHAGVEPHPAGTAVTVDARLTGLDGPAPWSAAIGARASAQLEAVAGDREITVRKLRVGGAHWTFDAAGGAVRSSPAASAAGPRPGLAASIASVHANWTLVAPDLSALDPQVAGRLRATGRIAGAPRALAGDARITARLALNGSTPGTLTATLHAGGGAAAGSGSLRVAGEFDEAPLRFALAWRRAREGGIEGEIHEGAWKSVLVAGNFALDRGYAPARASVRVEIGNLVDLDRFAGADLRGRLAATGALETVAGRRILNLRASAAQLRVGGLAASGQASASGPLDAMDLHVTAHLPEFRGAPVAIATAGVLDAARRSVRVTAASIDYRGKSARLLAPADLSYVDGLSIGELRLGLAGATLKLAGRVAPELALQASLQGAMPGLVDLVAPGLLAQGQIDASASLRGPYRAPSGELRWKTSGLRAAHAQALGLPAVDVSGEARFDGAAARIDVRIDAGRKTRLTVAGRVPLRADGPLDVKAGGTIDLGLAAPSLEARGIFASGTVHVAVSAAGELAAPQLAGELRLSDGRLRDYVRGLNLEHIAATFVGDGESLSIKSFSASIAPGTVSATGRIGVLQPDMPLDLRIVARNARPIASNLITANVDADLHVGGTALRRIELAGTIRVHRAVIGIPKALPPNVAVLDVRRRGQVSAPAPSAPLVVALDLNVDAPRQIYVRGRGLDAELGGDLRLGGTVDEPSVAGGFDLQRGSLDLAGSRLSFTSGHVGFNGAGLRHRIDPTLDFTAQTTSGGIQSTLRVTGLADAPRFELTSVPSMPPDEILSSLLFGGRNPAQISALQAAQIGAALATLSGVGGEALNPLGKLQRALGLDRLTVGAAPTAGTGTGPSAAGASIAAGRYISPRVYVEAKQTTTGSSQIQVSVDLTRHLKLQTRLGNGSAITQGTTPENDPGSSIGLSYQFEY